MATKPNEARRFYETVVLPYQGDDCLFWSFGRTTSGGYGQIRLCGVMGKVSRFACIAVHGEPPTPQHHAAHSCGRGKQGCVNPRHVRWATRLENEADKLKHGTRARGERAGGAKLTEVEVCEIRASLGVASQSALAKRFGVTQSIISGIKTGSRWGHVK